MRAVRTQAGIRMKPAAAIIPAVAALLLHGGLALIAANLLSPKDKAREPPKPIEVALIPQEPPAQPSPPVPVLAPAPPPQPAPPAPSVPSAPPVPPAPLSAAPPAPAKVERKRPPPKPRAERKPALEPQPSQPQTAAPAIPPEERPAPSATPSATSTAPPAAAPPSPPRTPVSISASYAATNRRPEYPRLSRQLEEQGTVVLRVLVRADGTAGAVEIRTSSGFALLDQSARSAVQTWRFNPATQDGKPVDEWFLIPIPFKLQN